MEGKKVKGKKYEEEIGPSGFVSSGKFLPSHLLRSEQRAKEASTVLKIYFFKRLRALLLILSLNRISEGGTRYPRKISSRWLCGIITWLQLTAKLKPTPVQSLTMGRTLIGRRKKSPAEINTISHGCVLTHILSFVLFPQLYSVLRHFTLLYPPFPSRFHVFHYSCSPYDFAC